MDQALSSLSLRYLEIGGADAADIALKPHEVPVAIRPRR